MPASSPGGLLRGLHHRFLHAVFACPIQADLVAIGVVEISMPPTPGHHAWQLGDVKPFLLEIAAELSSSRTSKYRRTPSLKTETSGPAWCKAIVRRRRVRAGAHTPAYSHSGSLR